MTENDFIFQINNLTPIADGEITWKTPSNIALVKYWGKSDPQIPKNTSVSFTLDQCHTITTLNYKRVEPTNDFKFDIYFEGELKESFRPKIETFFNRIEKYVPFLKEFQFKIDSQNSFPHSSGIASSASGMGALALCIMSIEKALNTEMTQEYFNQKASFLARLGSGSACRSIEGELIVWGAHPTISGSSDLYGVPFDKKVHANFKNYQDTILLVDEGEKVVSSTVGHGLMKGHPFAEQRFIQANKNIELISETLVSGDLKKFIEIVESEALSLHGMMMTSMPYFILMKPNTLKIIERIWSFRKETNSNVCFTLDAGANVHVLYPFDEKVAVEQFIEKELALFCQENRYICDNVGNGAKQLSNKN